MSVRLTYPEYRIVAEHVIMGWARDAYLDGDIPDQPVTLTEAIDALESLGYITVAKSSIRETGG